MSWKDNTIMQWDTEKVSDHNRSALTVEPERIERKQRMIDGTMRKYFVGIKKTFSCSWENLPSVNYGNSGTVDGGMSGKEMLNFVNESTGPVSLVLKDGQGNSETYLVYFEDFSYEVNKRGANVDWWNVNVTMVEV